MKLITLLFISIITIIIQNKAISATKCPEEYKKLEHVRSQLRHRSTAFLQEKERKAHKKYNDCRRKRNVANSNSSNSKKKKLYKSKVVKKKYKLKSAKEFNTDKVIVNGKFTGDKQKAWVKYYKEIKPKKCIKPTNTQVFAKCNEHMKKYAKNFDKLYKLEKPKTVIFDHAKN